MSIPSSSTSYLDHRPRDSQRCPHYQVQLIQSQRCHYLSRRVHNIGSCRLVEMVNREKVRFPRNLPPISPIHTTDISEGEVWKTVRKALSPTFTSGKLKLMTDPIANEVNRLIKHIENKNFHDQQVCSQTQFSFFLFGGFGGYFLQMVTDLNNRVALLLKYSGKWKSEVEVES